MCGCDYTISSTFWSGSRLFICQYAFILWFTSVCLSFKNFLGLSLDFPNLLSERFCLLYCLALYFSYRLILLLVCSHVKGKLVCCYFSGSQDFSLKFTLIEEEIKDELKIFRSIWNQQFSDFPESDSNRDNIRKLTRVLLLVLDRLEEIDRAGLYRPAAYQPPGSLTENKLYIYTFTHRHINTQNVE